MGGGPTITEEKLRAELVSSLGDKVGIVGCSGVKTVGSPRRQLVLGLVVEAEEARRRGRLAEMVLLPPYIRKAVVSSR